MMRVSQCFGLLGLAWTLSIAALAQTGLPSQGTEINPIGKIIGDQVHPQLALSSSGGYLVWEDNTASDGATVVRGVPISGLGYGAGTIRLISEGINGDNQNAQVAILGNGGRAVVWQGGTLGFQKIYARIINADNTFATSSFRVNTYTNNEQIDPVISVLPDGNLIVVWTSVGQDGDLAGVFGRRISSAGEFLGEEFQINQFYQNNQRTASIAVLKNGNVIIAWVSEQQGSLSNERCVDLYGRYFKPTGVPINSEFMLNEASNTNTVCANPQLSPLPNGGFTIVWSQKTLSDTTNSWDIYTRPFNKYGAPAGTGICVNSYTYGDQFGPKIAVSGTNQVVVWTSLLQDGDWEGVYGRILDSDGKIVSDEFRVNTGTVSRQLHPAVGADGTDKVLVLWSGYGVGETSFDVFAKAYGNVAAVLPRLTVTVKDQITSLQWNTQSGLKYQVQISTDLDLWVDAGVARTAISDTDTMELPIMDSAAYYRVLVLQ
jgi:hypothetical protein